MTDRIEAALFDLDGTITDSAAGILASFRHALSRFGLSPSDNEIRRWIGPPLVDGFAGLGVPREQVDEAVAVYREHFSVEGIVESRVYPGVAGMLQELASAGVRLAVATSKLTEYAERIVNQVGLAARFEVVVGSTRDGSRLQKEDIVSYALTELGNPDPSMVAMVGDREDDMYAALRHRLRAIGVTWGYGSVEELQASGAQVLVGTPGGLCGVLLLPGGSDPEPAS